jgi:hypothetical protein
MKTQREYRYSSTLSLTSAVGEMGDNVHDQATLPLGNRSGIHCTGSWVVATTGLDNSGKFHPHQDLSPRTFEPTDSCYAAYTTLAHISIYVCHHMF